MTPELYHNTLSFPLTGISSGHTRWKSYTFAERIAATYDRLLNLGTHVIKDNRQIKYIQISNFVAMTSLLASVVYIFLAMLWGNLLWFTVVSSLGLASVVVLLLNEQGSVTVSRVFYLIAADTLIYLAALIAGPTAHSENFLLIAVLIPFLIFDLRKPNLIVAGITAPIVFLLSYRYFVPYFEACHLSLQQQNILQMLNVPMEIGLVIAAVFQFVYYSEKTEMELESSNELLTIHTAELKRSNADLEQFAYIISHDLKGPVRNIACFMKLLSTKHGCSLDAEAREFVDYAISGSKRMERLIDDVLAYSRIGRNLQPPTAPVNLNDVIRSICYEMKGEISARNCAINISRELPVINSVHSSLMYHIFQNLINNGLKFNRGEKPEINLSWESTSENYIFSVNDNGIGINKKFGGQIFQMFKRLHAEDEYDGTGIGLAICKKIVEHYNGEIWFDSDGVSGTTFYFTIRKT